MSPRRTSRKGRFVVLEGLDGAGTTTQARRLAEVLDARGRASLITREPSGGPAGALLRQALTGRLGLPGTAREPLDHATLALLFAADRTDHLNAEIRPALEAGKVVICDRYLLSSLAYQGAFLPLRWVREINAQAVRPDLTVFLEVPVRVASARRARRGEAEELFEADRTQRAIARRYSDAIRLCGREQRVVRIDGSLPVETVTERAWRALEPLL